MRCSPTQSDIKTAIDNHKAFHVVRQNMNRSESLEYLDSDNVQFVKDNGKYVLVDNPDIKLKTTVTTKIQGNKTFESERGEGAAETGNYVHDVLEEYGQQILDELSGKSVTESLRILTSIRQKGLKKTGKTLDQKSRDNLFDIIRNQFVFVYQAQQAINQKTGVNELPVVKLEHLVIDPVDNIGGTIDFLAILSDNTFVIRDYKTISSKRESLDAVGDLKPDVTLIHYKSLEKYKTQISMYASILRKRYGFKGVYSNRLIPIKLFSAFNSRTKTFDNKIQYVAGPGQDKLIDEIIPFTEKTGFESLDDFLGKIDARIERLARNKDVSKRQYVNQQIADLEKIKQEIITKKSVNAIQEFVIHINKQLENMDDLSIDDLGNIYNELNLFKTLNDATFEYRKFLNDQGIDTSAIEQQTIIINTLINDTLARVKQEWFNHRLARVVAEETGEKIVDEAGNIIPFSPEGYFAAWFYQLSQFNNPIFQTLRAKLDKAHFEKNKKIDELTEQVVKTENDVIRYLKQKGMVWQDFIKLIINREDNLIEKTDKKWLKEVSDGTGEDYPNQFNVVEYYDWKERRNVYEKKLDSLYPTDPARVQRELEKWDGRNSLELKTNGKAMFPLAWKNARANGKLTFKEDVIVYSAEFEKIRQVPEFLNYYNLLESKNREFRKMLGVEYKQLPNNFIPNIRKSASERIDEWGMKGVSSSVDDFIKDFSVREDDRSSDDSYLKRDSIPKFFLNPFRDKDGNIINGEKSYQLGRSLLLFAKMAYNYDEMTKIEGEVLGLRELLVEKGLELQQSDRGLKTNLLGNNFTQKLSETDIVKTFDRFVQMYVYGLSVEPVIGDKSGKTEKMLLQMKNYFTIKKLGFNILSATGGFIAAKIQSVITGKTGIYYDEQQYSESIKASYKSRKEFLALSAYFDPMGHRYGAVRLEESTVGETQLGDSSQRGFINKYVNSRLLMKPYSIGDEYIEEVVTYALSQNYYVTPDGLLKKVQFPEDKEKYKGRFIKDLFKYEDGKATLNIPEDQQKQIWIAFRRAVQVVQSGIKGTIPEEDKAVWQGQLVGTLVGNFKSWMPGVMTERFGKVKYDKRVDTVYMGRFTAIMQEFGTQKINSQNENLQLGLFVRDIVLPKLGQLAMQVASFHTIGGYFKGFKMKDDGTARLMYENWLARNPQYDGKVSYKEFRSVQEKQLKASIIELRIILGFLLLATLAMGDWDDDGEKDYKKYFLTKKLVSVILKVKQEISFFVNPTEFINLTKNPIPMIGLLQDGVKTINNTFDELYDVTQGNITLGEKTLITGEKDSDDRKNIGSYAHAWIPGVGGLFQFFNVLSDDVQYLGQQN